MTNAKAAVALWLMRRRCWPLLHGNVQRWAIHAYLQTFPSYRRLTAAGR